MKQQAAMLHCELPTTFDYQMFFFIGTHLYTTKCFSKNNFMCFLKSYQIMLTKEQGWLILELPKFHKPSKESAMATAELPSFPLFKRQHSRPIRSLQHLACFLLCDVFVRKPHLTHNNEHKYITNRQTVWPLDYICGRGAQTLVVTEHMQIELSM